MIRLVCPRRTWGDFSDPGNHLPKLPAAYGRASWNELNRYTISPSGLIFLTRIIDNTGFADDGDADLARIAQLAFDVERDRAGK